MAFIDKTKANYSFKVLQGKAHTANDRELANETIASGLILSANRIFANVINSTPAHMSNVGVVSELVTLTIKPIAGSDGQNLGTWAGYRCYLEGSIPSTLVGVTNPLTGSAYALGDVIGNIIPQSFGADFRPILYSDASATVEIPPSDASDWFIDPFAGVITQEADDTGNMFKTSTTLTGPHNGRVKAYIYIGEYVIDLLGGTASGGNSVITGTDWINSVVGTSSVIPSSPSNGDRVLLDGSASGITFSQYNIDTDTINLFTASGWEAVEYYVGGSASGWVVTEPDTAMTVTIETDENAIYQYYGGVYKRQGFESTYHTIANKNMSCNITTVDGDEAISFPITYTPSEGSYVEILLNGVQLKIENSATIGSAVTSPCYFSNDGGTTHSLRTVRNIKDIKAGDKLYWMESNAGYDLDTTDRMDWNYVIFSAP